MHVKHEFAVLYLLNSINALADELRIAVTDEVDLEDLEADVLVADESIAEHIDPLVLEGALSQSTRFLDRSVGMSFTSTSLCVIGC